MSYQKIQTNDTLLNQYECSVMELNSGEFCRLKIFTKFEFITMVEIQTLKQFVKGTGVVQNICETGEISQYPNKNSRQYMWVLEKITGRKMENFTLRQWLEMYGPIGENLGKVMSKQIFTELAQMHLKNISHGQVNLQSILIDIYSFCPKFSNFEKVHKIDIQAYKTMLQIMKNINNYKFIQAIDDFRMSDIFQLAQILFQIVTGSDPFTYVLCQHSNKVKILGEEHIAKSFINNTHLNDEQVCQKYKLVFDGNYMEYWELIDPCNTLSQQFKNLIECLFDQKKLMRTDLQYYLQNVLRHEWFQYQDIDFVNESANYFINQDSQQQFPSFYVHGMRELLNS